MRCSASSNLSGGFYDWNLLNQRKFASTENMSRSKPAVFIVRIHGPANVNGVRTKFWARK